MKLGAEPKKVAILAGLLLTAAYLFYSNYHTADVPRTSAPGAPSVATGQPAAPTVPGEVRDQAPRETSRLTRQEFRPSLKPRRPEDRLDPATADPALRLDLLARLQQVKFTGGMRSLFEFGQAAAAPPPKAPEAKILPKQAARKFMGPLPPPPPEPPKPVFKPQAPPIPLRFFGYVTASRGGGRRAFFLEGEEIFVAGEGELVKKRYKVVRIGVNSVIMEDTQFEGQQTLPLTREMGG
jgi:hypothetical protein